MKHKIVILMVVLILGVSVVGAQTGVVFEDFEDGNIDSWTINGGGSDYSVEGTTELEGDFALNITGDSDGTGLSIEKNIVNKKYNKTSFLFKQENTDDDGSFRLDFTDASADASGVWVFVRGNNGGDVLFRTSDEFKTSDPGIIEEGTIYRFTFTMYHSSNLAKLDVYYHNNNTLAYQFTNSTYNSREFNGVLVQNPDDRGVFLTDYIISGVPTNGIDTVESNLEIDINPWMQLNSTQPYTITLNKTNTTTGDSNLTDVTKNANVTIYNITNTTGFSNPIATVNNSTDTIVSYNETGIVAVNATYNGETVNATNLTVAPRNLGNIGILPPGQWICGFLECDGNEDGEFYIGSTTQWLIFIVIVASGFGRAFDNDWVGIGLGMLTAILLWVVGFVSIGMVFSVIFFGIFVGVLKVRVTRNSGGETTVNINDARNFNR